MFLIGFSILLFVFYALLILYYLAGWVKLPETFYQVSTVQNFSTIVSVIIPARNEAENIAICLEKILAQTYPANLLEIIVVDDFSTDETATIVQQFQQKNKQVQIIKLDAETQEKAYKKRAIEKGISAANGTLIICTDADCLPHKNWVATLVQTHQKNDAQFIAAPVLFTSNGSLLHLFQALDFMALQGITAASVGLGFHSMCNGANLAYTKQAFLQVDGFQGIDKIPTGDDMLLMHKIYQKYPQKIAYLKDKNAIVETTPALTWKQFFNQRIRWASKATHYDDKRIFYVLFLVYLFNALFLVLGIAGFFAVKYWLAAVWLLAAKTLLELAFLIPVAKFYGKIKWLIWFPFLQPLHIFYTLMAGWLGRFGKYEWKGRTIDNGKFGIKNNIK